MTLTVGFGGSLFDDRFGLAGKRPPALADLPKFPRDQLIPEISGGDLGVQACAHAPQSPCTPSATWPGSGFGKVSVRWSQLGFGRTSSTSRAQTTPSKARPARPASAAPLRPSTPAAAPPVRPACS
ncbi:Dyp-type peroxidase domain-containing protein [Nonomuraea sp. NPDC046802]|uniref:Dyp-type peroxidase domain-containing protein n=1 Tax=Nonomuraea sp. NPDC046802 TaxID=3154919 RepID=UPI003405352C